MEKYVAETEALETRVACALLVAAASSKIRPDQTRVVVLVTLDEIGQFDVAFAEEVNYLVADSSRNCGNAL